MAGPPSFAKQEILCRSSLHFILINTNVVEDPDRQYWHLPGQESQFRPRLEAVARCLPPDKPTEFSVENMVMVAGPQVEGGRCHKAAGLVVGVGVVVRM